MVDPAGGQELVPRRYILFETHFGRAHRASGRYIDLLVWIDTPSDVALARNVRDFLQPLCEVATAHEARERAGWIDTYLRNHLASVRHLVRAQRETVSADAAVRVDGTGMMGDTAERVRRQIVQRLP